MTEREQPTGAWREDKAQLRETIRERDALAARLAVAESTWAAQQDEREGLHEWIEAAEQMLHFALAQADATGLWPRERIREFLQTPSAVCSRRASRLANAEHWIQLVRDYAPEVAARADRVLTARAATPASLPTQHTEQEWTPPPDASAR